MQYGVCSLSIIPMRSSPDDRAEMVNQILFGESFQIIETQKKWSRVQLAHDHYQGWIDNLQITHLSDEQYFKINSSVIASCTELIEIISDPQSGSFFPVLLGSLLPAIQTEKRVLLGDRPYEFAGPFSSDKLKRESLVEFAYQYLNAPYLWGGRTPLGIDCSGFTQMVYRLAGYSLPRDSGEQAQHGITLSFIEEAEPGDLCFFDNDEGKIIHVGIILSDNYILHASGKVRLDRLDQTGIFNSEKGTHTHKLRVMKKII